VCGPGAALESPIPVEELILGQDHEMPAGVAATGTTFGAIELAEDRGTSETVDLGVECDLVAAPGQFVARVVQGPGGARQQQCVGVFRGL
jgi:hypothetical protein